MNYHSVLTLLFILQFYSCVSLSNNASVNWSCLTNLSCINSITDQVKSGGSVDLGFLQIENKSTKQLNEGILPLKSRSLKLSFGSMVLDISASRENSEYLEVKFFKNEEEGRSGRKRMQMFVPVFMVASQIGWYMLALKLVTTLAIKALLVAKLAFFVAAIITIKKFILEPMHVSPAAPFYDNIDPFMVPYDFPTFSQHELHPLSIAHLGHETSIPSASAIHPSNPVAAESSVNTVTEYRTGISNASAVLTNSKDVKRSDYSIGRQPLYYNYYLKAPFKNINS